MTRNPGIHKHGIPLSWIDASSDPACTVGKGTLEHNSEQTALWRMGVVLPFIEIFNRLEDSWIGDVIGLLSLVGVFIGLFFLGAAFA